MRARPWWAALLVLVLGLAGSGGAGAHGGHGGGGHAHPEGSDLCWIILGTKKGKKLKTTPASGAMIATGPILEGVAEAVPASNFPTGANGTIHVGTVADPHCKCAYHFHGELFGEPDPNSLGCGWGCAVPCDQVSAEVADLAIAVTAEFAALRLLLGGPTDEEMLLAALALGDAIDALERIKGAGSKSVKKKAGKIIQTDQDALAQVEANSIAAAVETIRKTLPAKQKLLKKLKPKIPKPAP